MIEMQEIISELKEKIKSLEKDRDILVHQLKFSQSTFWRTKYETERSKRENLNL